MFSLFIAVEADQAMLNIKYQIKDKIKCKRENVI